MGFLKRSTLLLGLVVLIVSINVSGQETEQTGRTVSNTLMVEGVERSYHTYIPDAFAPETAILVIALHPSVSSGKAMQAMTGLDSLADAANALVVYPDSNGYFWDDGRTEAELLMPAGPQSDLTFVTMLIDQLLNDHGLDTPSVYLVGFDGGGGFAYRIACEMSEQITGMAVVTTTMWDYHYQMCPDEGDALNVLLLHAGRDVFYPDEGRVIPGRVRDYTITTLDGTATFWTEWNNCVGEPIYYARDRVRVYSDCSNETETVVYRMPQAGHHWMRIADEYRLNQFGMDATHIITEWVMGEVDWSATEITSVPLPPVPRTYRLYVPTTYDPAESTPMVMVLHGRPDNGLGIALITEMNRVAEENGFIAVYPDGIDQEWNYVRGVPLMQQRERDDAEFYRDLIADLSIDLNIDMDRVYLTGFSNGGFMTERQICESPDTFAAYAFIGSTLFPGITNLCEDAPPVPILYMHGNEDVSIPWEGSQQVVPGLSEAIYISYPVPATIAYWGTHNGCVLDTEYEEIPATGEPSGTSVFRTEFDGCEAPFHVYLILNGGHNWPGVPGMIRDEIAGRVNTDIHASEEIWAFFSQHTLDTRIIDE